MGKNVGFLVRIISSLIVLVDNSFVHHYVCSVLKHSLNTLQNKIKSIFLFSVDSGYPSECWLLTPILNAVDGSREAAYTAKHIKARNCVERCIGVLKGRFRCILKHRTLEYAPVKAGKIINACAILHNMCTMARLPLPAEEAEETEEATHSDTAGFTTPANLERALQVRNSVIQRI